MIGRESFGLGAAALVAGAALLLPAAQNPAKAKAAPAKPSRGEVVYRQACIACHGDRGKGGPAYPRPLVGTRTVSELARFIHQEMPPGPATISKADAEAVAAWMHNAFYSPLAQERNAPPRLNLARLTVKQYQNAVADIVADFPRVVPSMEAQGLKGEYFAGRSIDGRRRLFDRVDPEVAFDFGTDGPAPKPEAKEFSAAWSGSVLAPETGVYEFVLRTPQAVRLWINGQPQPLVDAWVKSSNDTEARGSIMLLGGRAYPIRIEFSKAIQGVNNGKELPPTKATMEFLWRRPKLALEPVPRRYLYPEATAPTFVVETNFPPDDRSTGYERGNNVSREWNDATTFAAFETANYVANNLPRLAGVAKDAPDGKEKARPYFQRFLERAFRRPLDKATQSLYLDRQLAESPNLEVAAKRIVTLALKSPRFLYREVGANDAYDTASHLSFSMWDTVPDPALIAAAADGSIMRPDVRLAQATRMSEDPRAWNKMRDFLLLWLKVDAVPDLVKSQRLYPGFDAQTATDLRSSLEIFLREVAWSKESDYRQLMLSDTQYLNGRLAKLYGADLPPSAPFQAVNLDEGQRAGVLTQPYVLARFAYLETSSPIHRGVLVARSFLGRGLQPPPAAFTPLAPSLHPGLTTRQRVELQTKPDGCNNCHDLINPLGFALERFDAIGRVRERENGKPINANGTYVNRTGTKVSFTGAVALAKYLASSDEAHAAFVEKMVTHMAKQPTLAFGPRAIPNLEKDFSKDYNVRRLMASVAVTTAIPAK